MIEQKIEDQSHVDAADSGVHQVNVRILPGGRITPKDTAVTMNNTEKTLANWRCQGIGPRPIKVGGRVFYEWAEVQAMSLGQKPIRPEAA